jgi:hypothetical protein
MLRVPHFVAEPVGEVCVHEVRRHGPAVAHHGDHPPSVEGVVRGDEEAPGAVWHDDADEGGMGIPHVVGIHLVRNGAFELEHLVEGHRGVLVQGARDGRLADAHP